jgi:outer membrane receptor protein involved in Fe transport
MRGLGCGGSNQNCRFRSGRLRARLLATCAVAVSIGAAGGAFARDDGEDAEGMERLVVTGTRIQRSGFTTPTPVTVIGRQTIDDLGLIGAGEILQQLPMNNPEVTATQTSVGSLNGYVSDANIGAELANLRGLNLAFGTRTLTLVDGHRFVPSTNGGAVDVGLIPANLILRTETVTGGASAAYGSDAVAGVVNIALDHELTGIRGQVDFSETFRGDGEEKHVGLAGGWELFAGRGHAILGAEWTDSGAIGQCTATRDFCRPWSIFEEENPAEAALGSQYNLVSNSTATVTNNGTVIQLAFPGGAPFFNPFRTPVNAPPPGFMPGLVTYENLPAPFLNAQFNDAGSALVNWETGGFIDDGARLMAGGEGLATDDGVLLRVPVERESVYGRFQYELTNNLNAFVEASYGRRDATNSQATLGNSWIGSLGGILVKRDNAFLPDSVDTALGAAGASGFYLNKPISSLPAAYHPYSSADNKTYRIVTGLDGDFASGWLAERAWAWDVYYTYGKNEQAQRLYNLPRRSLTAAVGAGPAGQASGVHGISIVGFQGGEAQSGNQYQDGTYPVIPGDPNGIFGVANWNLAVDAVIDPVDQELKCRVNSSLRTTQQNDLLFRPLDQLPVSTPSTTTVTRAAAEAARAAGIPGLVAGCLPINVLGAGFGQGQTPEALAAALDWALGTQVEDYEYTQSVFGGNTQGEIFDIWSGPVIVAGGFEYRDESGETTHPAPVQYWLPDYGSDFGGSQKILEGYVETDFSIVRDLPLIQDLAINAAARRTHAEVTDETPASETLGETKEFDFTTWKVSGVWDVNSSLRFRATRSRDIRAPSFRELFFPGRPTNNFTIGITNPWLTELAGQDPAVLPTNQWIADPDGADLPRNGGGNPELLPETADTVTLGVVVQPGGMLDGLRVSVDGYQIELSDGIANVYTNGIISACYFLDDANACSRITPVDPSEDPLNGVVTDYEDIVTGSNNTSTFTVKGVDFEVLYTFELARLMDSLSGDLTLRSLTTYMDELLVEGDNRGTLFGVQQLLTFSGSDYAGQAGSGGVDDIASFSESPEWQGTVSGTYSNGPLRTTLQARWVGEAKLYNDLIGTDDPDWAIGGVNTLNVPNEVGNYINWMLSGSYNFGMDSDGGRDIEIFGVINNLFDRAPEIAPPITTGPGANSGGGSNITNPTFYDSLGRRYRVGVRFKF